MLDHDYLKHWQIQPGSLMIDLGATTGDFEKEFIGQIKQAGARIICFEPGYWNLGHLIRYVEDNMKENAVVMSTAVSARNGFIEFITADSGVLNHIGTVEQNWGHQVVYKTQMPTMSMDTVLDIFGEIDFVKCDIEGAELEVFLNCKNLRKIKNLCIAAYHVVNGEMTWKKLKVFFELNGFEVIHEWDDSKIDSNLLYCKRI